MLIKIDNKEAIEVGKIKVLIGDDVFRISVNNENGLLINKYSDSETSRLSVYPNVSNEVLIK